jgi:hypothetical protein
VDAAREISRAAAGKAAKAVAAAGAEALVEAPARAGKANNNNRIFEEG